MDEVVGMNEPAPTIVVRVHRAVRPAWRPAGVAVLFALAVFWPCRRLLGGAEVLDLKVYLSGARAVLDGRDLYGAGTGVRQYGFTYPPFAALLFVAPTFVPLGLAILAMTLASLAALAVVVRLGDPDLLRRAVTGQSVVAVLLIVAMIACQPVRTNLWNGQVNLLLAALVMLDILGTRPRRSRGALIGLATAVKLTPALFVLYLVVRRRYREAATAVAAFAAATGLTWLLLPADSTEYWTNRLYDTSRIGDLAKPSNQSIRGDLERLVGHHDAVLLWSVTVLPVLALGLWLARRVSLSGREPFAVAIVGITECLVSPVSWSHHWVWFVPWMAGLAASAQRRGAPARVATAAFVLYIVGINTVTRGAIESRAASRLLVHNSYTLAAVVACAFAVLGGRTRPLRRASPGGRAEPSRDAAGTASG